MNSKIISITLTLATIGVVILALPQSVAAANSCAGVDTSLVSCTETDETAIMYLIRQVVQVLVGGVGVLAVGAVAFGAILYASAADSPENIKKAKTIWMNTALGLITFAFMVAITNFIIPGGVF